MFDLLCKLCPSLALARRDHILKIRSFEGNACTGDVLRETTGSPSRCLLGWLVVAVIAVNTCKGHVRRYHNLQLQVEVREAW